MSVDHYENFPVASVLCPPHLRAPIRAIYRFARTADDLADEGDATTTERMSALAAYRGELNAAVTGQIQASSRWPQVFEPLVEQIREHQLPAQLLHDLLDAFEQDVRQQRYATRTELLDYCRRSANPVGRLLLHLYGIADAASLAQSDAICTALQLANFWQDVRIDAAKQRVYVPHEDLAKQGLDADRVLAQVDTPGLRAALADVSQWTRRLMSSGAPLVDRIPGRAGWELRLVVQGGMRILEKLEGRRFDTTRPTLGALDAPLLLWRALTMRVRTQPAHPEAA